MKRKILWIAGGIAGLLLLLVIAIPLFVDVDRFRPAVEAQLSNTLGRKVAMGKLSLSLLAGGVTAEKLAIADDPAFSRTPFLQAQSVHVGVEMLPLIFSRSLRIRSLTLVEPELTLVRAPSGKWNFSTLAAGKKEAAPAADGPELSVGELRMENGKVSVGRASRAGTQVRTYEKVNLVARNLSLKHAITFALDAVTPGGGSLEAEGKAGPVNREDAARTPIDAAVKVNGFDLAASGFLDPGSGLAGLLNFEGKVHSDGEMAHASGTLTAEKLRVVRSGRPATQAVRVEFASEYDPVAQKGSLTKGDIRTGNSTARLSGPFDARGETPVVHLKLNGDKMAVGDVSGLLPAVGVTLPPGSSLQGGVVTVNLSLDGPVDRLVTTGGVNVSNTRLAGFNLGSRMSALSAFTGVKTGSETQIEMLTSRLRVAPEGIRADDLKIVVPSMGTVTGQGTIGANNALNFRMKAQLAGGGGALGGLSTLSTFGQSKGAIPFLIQGTTSNPIFVPDVAGAMTQTVTAPAGGLEALGGLFGKKKKE